MKNLQVIERDGLRVLTTVQLAEVYGTDAIKIQQNFSNNKDRYKKGKHFLLLIGDELKEFKGNLENFEVAPTVNKLYLWTEKGAWLHAKSLNTDKAWEAYEMLVDEYYRIKENNLNTTQLSPTLQMFDLMFKSVAKMELSQKQMSQEINTVKTELTATTERLDNIKETLIQRDENWRENINRMLNRVVGCSDKGYRDVRAESYVLLEERGHCHLGIRKKNLKERLAKQGATKTQINKVNHLDVIENDPKLKEIYTSIVKELTIKFVS